MAGACAVPAVLPVAAVASSGLSPGSSSFVRLNCWHEDARVAAPFTAARRNRGRARLSSRDTGEAETDGGAGQILKGDSSYLWTLGLGSVGGAAVIKYGSILLPDITRPNIVQALLMVSLPVVAAVFILLKASSADD